MQPYKKTEALLGSGAHREGAALTAKRVLIVEGDPGSAESLQQRLTQAGYAAATLQSGEDVINAVNQTEPHLVLLDWDLPGVMTMSLVRHVVRRGTRDRAPRLMALSSHTGEQHVVEGLELGLDDYLTRPFSIPELLARVRALLRQRESSSDAQQSLEFHGLRIDLVDARASVFDHRVHLRTVEFRLLEFLLRHPERAFSREQLLSHAWGREHTADVRAVDVTVQRIRKALETHSWKGYLQTIRGVGYRLSAFPEQR